MRSCLSVCESEMEINSEDEEEILSWRFKWKFNSPKINYNKGGESETRTMDQPLCHTLWTILELSSI